MRNWRSGSHPSVRDTALLGETLRALKLQLASAPERSEADHNIEDLVSRAIAALQRLEPHTRLVTGGIAPVLGAGVLTQLLSHRHAAPQPPAGSARVDTRR